MCKKYEYPTEICRKENKQTKESERDKRINRRTIKPVSAKLRKRMIKTLPY